MNREAVAMAADSAVTAGSKIHQSNKLFTLSKIFPVGVMISNAADFMGVPWETIVKMYRERTLNEQEKISIEDYCNHFLRWMHDNEKLCSEAQKRLRIFQIITSHLHKVLEEAQTQWMKKLVSEGRCSPTQKSIIVKRVLTNYRDYLKGFPDYEFQQLSPNMLSRRFKKELTTGVDSALGELNLTRASRSIALQCARLSILKHTASDLNSTIAIAGFGGEEFFPSLTVLQIDGVIANEIKIIKREIVDVDRSHSVACIKPLAQSEMVRRFMEGMDHNYQTFIENYFWEFCRDLGMTDAQSRQVLEKFKESADQFRDRRFVQPIIRTLINLPKHDMAKMAEALVSLTSLKRRVSEELETVADPIDVAVISKGDGFVWIKRKHYFSTDLNPHFSRNYLRGTQS